MPSSTLVDPNFSQTFSPAPCADPDGAAGDTAGALDGAPLPAGGDADPDDAEGAPDPDGALEEAPLSVAEPVAESDLAAGAEEGGTAPEVLGANVLGEPAVVAATPVPNGAPVAEPDGDPVELCGAVVAEGAGPVEEEGPESERDVVTEP